MAQRTIIVGDIHACWQELQRLLERCGRTSEDEVVSVGDLVDRGPEPAEVVRFFREDGNAIAILGNHEDRHVRIVDGELPPARSQFLTWHLMGGEYPAAVDWFRGLPLYLERHGACIVHAGLRPGVALRDQPRNALLRAKMPWMKSIFDSKAEQWWHRYDGDAPVIYGHCVHPEVLNVGRTWGVDTGACVGGTLSAIVLPEWRIVEVRARENLWAASLWEHDDMLRGLSDPARRKPRKPRRARPLVPPHRTEPISVDGVTVGGAWLLDHYGLDRRHGGPWVGQLVRRVRDAVEAGEVGSLSDVSRLLPTHTDEAGRPLLEALPEERPGTC